MKHKFKIIVVLVAVLSLSVTSFAYAGVGNGRDKGYEKENGRSFGMPYGQYKKVIERGEYREIASNRIRINGHGFRSDLPPVIKIKEGRTLIPVRAFTNSIGGYVFWEIEGPMIATVIDPEGLIRIDFDLATGNIFIYDWGDDDDLDPILENYPADPEEDEFHEDWGEPRTEGNTSDVYPGLINNRTFVPLRFIAVVFNMHTDYDPLSGKIDIYSGKKPILDPDEFDYDDESDFNSTSKRMVEIITFDKFVFKGVYFDDAGEEKLNPKSSDSDQNYDYRSSATKDAEDDDFDPTTQPAIKVIFSEDFIEDLENKEETSLWFKFKEGTKEFFIEFVIDKDLD